MQKVKKKYKIKPITVIVLIAVLIVVIISAKLILSAATLKYDKIYKGIYVGDVYVGEMTEAEALETLKESYDDKADRMMTLNCEGNNVSFMLGEIDFKIDAEMLSKKAFAQGREGTKREKLSKIRSMKRKGLVLDVMPTYNDEKLSAKIEELATLVDVPEVELSVELVGTELVATKGKSGMRIIKDNAKKHTIEAILKKGEKTVKLIREEVNPTELTVDYLLNEVCGEPVDATYSIENQKLIIIDEKVGISINKSEAKRLIAEMTGATVNIPATVKQPEVTAATLKANLFPDLLATYSSKYNASNAGRSHNVALAAQFINEVVLAPGDIFSYNDTVGPRTAERGFREAGVYVGNKVEQGLGGGICQVSSTLYNTVVLSDLKIVYRANHSLPVSYVPLGRDATVSYGSIDFKFENNTENPIKIVATASGGNNVVSIYGVKADKQKSIDILTECTATYPPEVEQTEDPTLPAGTVKVEQKGTAGSTYITYKITKQNGIEVKRERIARSTYSATNRIEIVGTMAEPETSEELLAETPATQTAATEE